MIQEQVQVSLRRSISARAAGLGVVPRFQARYTFEVRTGEKTVFGFKI